MKSTIIARLLERKHNLDLESCHWKNVNRRVDFISFYEDVKPI